MKNHIQLSAEKKIFVSTMIWVTEVLDMQLHTGSLYTWGSQVSWPASQFYKAPLVYGLWC